MLIKIAMNGARPKSENEFIPRSSEEIREEVRILYQNDCRLFHIHCYDKYGNESLRPEDVHNLVTSVKNVSSDILIGISSGDWIEPDIKKRIDYIRNWYTVPDFISVNFIEEDALKVSEALIDKGVQIEAGLNEKKAAEIFVASNLSKYCSRVLIEPEESDLTSAVRTIDEIVKVLSKGNYPRILLHGFNENAWNLLREANERGYDSRIGMEDTIYLEDGTKVKSNLELINYARKIISEQN